MINYGFKKIVIGGFESVLKKTEDLLKKGGFGILTRIDMKEKFREKLGVEFKNYIILGACSPEHAYKAVNEEEDIGLMLPCNVIVYETEEGTAVSFIKPSVAMSMINNGKLEKTAGEVEKKLEFVFKSLNEDEEAGK